MSIINKNIRIDLAHDNVSQVIRLHEGDVNGATLKLAVYNQDTVFDFTGMTITYDATIAGNLAEEDASATFSGNIISIPVTANMTALSGVLKIDVKIKSGNDILIVQTIFADVQRAVINGSTVIDISGTTIAGKFAELEDDIDDLDSGKVDKTQKIAGIDLQDDIPVSELQDALLLYEKVPKTRKIAGINLIDDITATELQEALGIGESTPEFATMSGDSSADNYIDKCIDTTKIYIGSVNTGDPYAYTTRMVVTGAGGLLSQFCTNSIGKIRIRTSTDSGTTWGAFKTVAFTD